MNWKQVAVSFVVGVLGAYLFFVVRAAVQDHYLLGQLVSAWNDEHRPRAAQAMAEPTTAPTPKTRP